MNPVDHFVGLLAAGPADPQHVFNPWKDHDERDHAPRAATPRPPRPTPAAGGGGRARGGRLWRGGGPPPHRGCRFSGIPFCSEVEMFHKPALVAREALAPTSAGHEDKPMSERSAAIIWDELDRAGVAHEVVLWNAFPWHPHGADGIASNRKPRLPEVAQGRDAFDALLRCFTHDLEVFAVGKVAEDALRRWEKARCAGYIRHPSHGGEGLFRAQFRDQVVARTLSK